MATVLGILIYKEEVTLVNGLGMVFVLLSIVVLNGNVKKDEVH